MTIIAIIPILDIGCLKYEYRPTLLGTTNLLLLLLSLCVLGNPLGIGVKQEGTLRTRMKNQTKNKNNEKERGGERRKKSG